MKKLRLITACLISAGLLLLPSIALADVNDFVITSFESDQTLTLKDKQGELRIVEQINVDFSDNNHGLLRAIPERYKNHSLQLKINRVSSNSGAPSGYTTYHSNGNTVVKIGDPNRTVTGPQHYSLDYTVRNVITFYDAYDEIYWDVNGDQWTQGFNNVSMRLHLPDGLRSRSPACYTGAFGATESKCTVSLNRGEITATTTHPLTSRQTLTYVAAFEKGYFTPSSWHETLGEYGDIIGGIFVPFVLIGGTAWLHWWRRGRDARGRGVIVPQYDSPDGMKPMEIGALMDFKVDTKDITATIIDLAVRGYIKIIEEKHDRKLRKDILSYKLKLVKVDHSELNKQEQDVLNKIFGSQTLNLEVDISASKNKLYSLVEKLNKNVRSQLTMAGYFNDRKLPGNQIKRGGRSFLLILPWLIISAFAFKAFTLIGIGLGMGVLAVAWLFMDARTAKGVEAKEHVLGLKKYLETAEKDRIEKLQSPDAPYASQSGAPVKTVELFEKLLPYAMVLGVEQKWAKQFESLYTAPPDWYSGNWNTFNAAYLASSINSGVGSAVNSAFSAPSSSGSSGSGGGSSGGGGGGGGGGGW